MTLFKPGPRDHFDLPRPIMLVAGRVAPEKNLEAFLKLDLPGTKVVVGDGPSLETLKRRYPQPSSPAMPSTAISCACCRAPMSSSFRAAPTPSAW